MSDRSRPKSELTMFDIDRYLNRYVPVNRIDRLPYAVSRWFGYRKPDDDSLTDTLTPIIKGRYGYLLTNFWILINTFTGLIVTMCMCKYGSAFHHRSIPVLVPSWGAGSILVFNAVRAPLAQPRNTMFGTFLSSLVGVIVMKLFTLSEAGTNQLWVGAALSTAISSVVMTVTKTVHPPGGAAAMLPCIDADIKELGWYYLPLQLAIGCVFIGLGLLMNNIALIYPMYFWTPANLKKVIKSDNENSGEKFMSASTTHETSSELTNTLSHLRQLSITRTNDSNHIGTTPLRIVITPKNVELPPLVNLTEEQREVLEQLQYILDTVNVISPEDE